MGTKLWEPCMRCRVCGSDKLTPVINLGEQYLQGSFIKPGKELPPAEKIPTILTLCDRERNPSACGLLQLQVSVDPRVLYAAYWYRSGTNRTMREHLRGITAHALEFVQEQHAQVLDIGCNDGTLLSFYPLDFVKFGIDPSDVAHEVSGATVLQDTFPSPRLTQLLRGEKLDVVTSIAMFYDLQDPVGFVRSVADVLAPQGIWIFEMSYLPTMLEMNSYDTICHEHLEYYCLTVLDRIMDSAGMKIIAATLNDINGGSIRCVAVHNASPRPVDSFVDSLRRHETTMALDTQKAYLEFQRNIERQRDELMRLLRRLKEEGRRIHVYGASTKGNTLLQFCGIDNSIVDYAADRNPDKDGARTLGTNIPIINEAASRAMNPDYYLVLPWHFRAEFLDREHEMLERGVGMIFPLPTVEVFQKDPASRHVSLL